MRVFSTSTMVSDYLGTWWTNKTNITSRTSYTRRSNTARKSRFTRWTWSAIVTLSTSHTLYAWRTRGTWFPWFTLNIGKSDRKWNTLVNKYYNVIFFFATRQWNLIKWKPNRANEIKISKMSMFTVGGWSKIIKLQIFLLPPKAVRIHVKIFCVKPQLSKLRGTCATGPLKLITGITKVI